MADARRALSHTPVLPLALVRDDEPHSFARLVESAQRTERQGARAEARALYEAALRRLPRENAGVAASELLRWIARTHYGDGDMELALDCAHAAHAVAQAHGNVGAMGHATNILAGIHWRQGDIDEAERLYQLARSNALQGGEARLAAMTAQNLGVIGSIRGDIETALAYYSTSLAAYRELGMAGEVCTLLNNVGLVNTQFERWHDAERAYDEAMRVARLLGDHSTQLYIEVNRAEWSVAQRDYEGGRRACNRAMRLVAQVKDAPAVGELHKAFGVIERETGEQVSAEDHLQRAHAIATARQDMLLLADTTKELAELHRQQGRNRDALQYLNRAHRLYSQLRARRDLADIDQRMGRLESDFLDVVRRWGESIECNDDYTQGHCERVADIACALAKRDGMDPQSLFWFRIGALLHDVGKLVIPPAVLNKRGQLTPEEWALMRSHPTAGVEMLADVEFPWDVSPILKGHHERWDGRGYPHGLIGEAIPRVARMVCIADVYDALTSERSYKKAMSHANALDVMRADVGRQFDPALFALFEQVATEQGQRWTAPTKAVPSRRMTPTSTPLLQMDELTALPLRNAFQEAVRTALAARVDGQHVALLVLDIDHFKLINDSYGHLQGDAALLGIAGVLRAHTPDGGFVGRYAGDEFVILVPDASLADAAKLAERVRVAAHAVPVALGRSTPVALTVSIGVACASSADATPDTLFAAADAALYEAKRRGRDAVGLPELATRAAPRRPQLDAFVAREDERRRMVELLGRAAAGNPQVVSIVGEAGVGKSCLARSLGTDVRMVAGNLVSGRCADNQTRAPYWPWASVLGAVRALRIVPERHWRELTRLSLVTGRPVNQSDAESRLVLFEEVAEFLRLATAARPLVVVLDDMQWADAESWDLVEYLVARLDRERLLLCLTQRDEDADAGMLARRGRLSRDERFHELRVDRLAPAEVARWVTMVFQQELPERFVSYVQRQSEGNPFFATQTVSALLDADAVAWGDGAWRWSPDVPVGLPLAVRDLLGRRLARLSRSATKVLSAAAVLGRSIDLDVVVDAKLATEDELLDAIEEGIAARVVASSAADDDDRVSFTHGLLVTLLHEKIHPRRLRRIREQVEHAHHRDRRPPAARGFEGREVLVQLPREIESFRTTHSA